MTSIEAGPIVIDLAARTVTHDGVALRLTPKAFDLLAYLASCPERVVAKTELMASVWPGVNVDESNLTQTVFMIRRVLPDIDGHDWIVNVPKVGYRFVRPERAAPEPAAPEPVSPDSPGRDKPARIGWIGPAVAIAFVAVVVAITHTLRPATLDRVTVAGVPQAVDARLLYLEGRDEWNRRTRAGFGRARELFTRAIAADPRDPLPYSGLADTYSLMWAFGMLPRGEALPKARAAAQRSLQLGPDRAEGHASMSYLLWEDFDRVGGMAEIARAISVNPNYATARHWHSLFLVSSDRFDEALKEAQIAWTLDPNAPIIGTDYALALRRAGRIDDSGQLLEEIRRAHPTFVEVHVQLAEYYDARKRYAQAVTALQSAITLGDRTPFRLARLATLQWKAGNPAGAAAAMASLQAAERGGSPVSSRSWAEARCAVGDVQGAAAAIEHGISEQESWLGRVLNSDDFACLRRSAQWPSIVARVKSLPWINPDDVSPERVNKAGGPASW